MKGGFDYLDEVSKDAGSKPRQQSNLQTEQAGLENAPSEGGEGYIGGNTNAGPVGFDYIVGKKGSSQDRAIYTETSFGASEKDNAGSEDAQIKPSSADSTDEGASWQKVKTDDGLPQTFMEDRPNSAPPVEGEDESGDHKDPEGSAYLSEVGKSGKPVNQEQENVQSVPGEDYEGVTTIDMPQTEFTDQEGGGAPRFKHKG